MAEPAHPRETDGERLIAFTLGTFHTVAFVISAVLILHLIGALGDLLSGLNTLTGLALFAALWATTTWSTRRALRGFPGPVLATRTPVGEAVERAARSGALNGILFLAAAAVILALSALLTGQGENVVAVILGGVFFATFGTLAAAIAGAILGILFAAIDLVLVWAEGRLLRVG